jgi:hypothetical protein
MAEDYQDGLNWVEPEQVIRSLAAAVPAEWRQHIVVIGSLAAGYHGLRAQRLSVRTKDADCLLDPRHTAQQAATGITNALFDAAWTFKPWGGFTIGTSATQLDDLPVVRLHPPGSTDWFIELLTSARPNSPLRDPERITTCRGDLQLCGFPALDLAAHQAPEVHGVRVALPAMLALVNLIGHVEESGRTMAMEVAGRRMLRSSKDLGRVLALAYLAELDDQDGTAGISAWPGLWYGSLNSRYPEMLQQVVASCGDGLVRLRSGPNQIEDAYHSAIHGLLAGISPRPGLAEFTALIALVLSGAVGRMQRMVDQGTGR